MPSKEANRLCGSRAFSSSGRLPTARRPNCALLYLKKATVSFSQDPNIRAALEALDSTTVSVRSTSAAGKLADVSTEQKKRLPEVHEGFVLDAAGREVASSDGRQVGRDFSTTQYFARGEVSYFPGDVARDPENGQLC